MDHFIHEVLGDVSDETRWLKIFTTNDLVRLSVTAMACIFLMNVLPKTGFFIFIEVMIFLLTCVRVALGLIRKPKKKYLTGGGVPIYELFVRVTAFKRANRKKSIYTLGAEEEEDLRNGSK